MPPDREPPIEPENEFSDLARQLGNQLDDDSTKPPDEAGSATSGAPANGAGTEPSDEGRWTRGAGSTSGDPGGGYDAGAWGLYGDDGDRPAIRVGGSGRLSDRFREMRLARGCLYIVLLLVLLVVVSVVSCMTIFDGGGGDAETVGGGGGISVSPSASAAATESASATAAPTENPLQTGQDVLDALDQALGVLWQSDPTTGELVEDAVDDFLDSISGQTPTYTSPVIDMRMYMGTRLSFDMKGVNTAFNYSILECGTAAHGRTVVCPADVQPMPEGDVFEFAMMFEGDVPQASPDRSFIYSAVFDSDGNPANNWQFHPPYDFDLFQGADRWYQLIWDHNAQQWSLTVTQVDANQATGYLAGSAARAVIQGDTVVFYIPASEFQLELPPYRLTSFGHDGTFNPADRGADVSGVDPTAPLSIPPAGVQPASPPE